MRCAVESSPYRAASRETTGEYPAATPSSFRRRQESAKGEDEEGDKEADEKEEDEGDRDET